MFCIKEVLPQSFRSKSFSLRTEKGIADPKFPKYLPSTLALTEVEVVEERRSKQLLLDRLFASICLAYSRHTLIMLSSMYNVMKG